MKRINLKRQEKINQRKAETALSGIFDIKTDRLEDRLGKLPAKRKSKKSEKPATEADLQAPVTVALAPEVSELLTDFTSEATCINQLHRELEASTDFASEAESINQMHRELLGLGLTMLDRMFQIGERLSRIKDQLPHGAWEQWVDDHLQFTTRTARRYIRAFKHRGDGLALTDPVLFLEEIQGNAEPKSDTKSKSDVNVRFDGDSSIDPENDESAQKRKVDRRNLRKHWIRAAADAQEAIEQLIDLQRQYDDWFSELPDEQRVSELGDCLLTITQLDFDHSLGAIKAAASVDLPHAKGGAAA
jgi:Protein of unknown function (DUF3102)